MSRVQRTSAVAGLVLAAALVLTPAAQASGRSLPLGPATWLEAGLAQLAGWWERTLSPARPTSQRNGGEKIGSHIDPNGLTSPTPPPATWTPDERSEIGTGIDPNG